MATATSPFGPWTRRDAPVLATKPGTFYSFLTSNPAPYIDKDGSVLLLFKGRGHGDKFPYQTPMSIGVARAPRYEGPYTVVSDKPIFGVDHGGEVEDPFLWKDRTAFTCWPRTSAAASPAKNTPASWPTRPTADSWTRRPRAAGLFASA